VRGSAASSAVPPSSSAQETPNFRANSGELGGERKLLFPGGLLFSFCSEAKLFFWAEMFERIRQRREYKKAMAAEIERVAPRIEETEAEIGRLLKAVRGQFRGAPGMCSACGHALVLTRGRYRNKWSSGGHADLGHR
jgi:hypothetical protein